MREKYIHDCDECNHDQKEKIEDYINSIEVWSVSHLCILQSPHLILISGVNEELLGPVQKCENKCGRCIKCHLKEKADYLRESIKE